MEVLEKCWKLAEKMTSTGVSFNYVENSHKSKHLFPQECLDEENFNCGGKQRNLFLKMRFYLQGWGKNGS